MERGHRVVTAWIEGAPDRLMTLCDLRRCPEGGRKVLLPFQKVASDWRLES